MTSPTDDEKGPVVTEASVVPDEGPAAAPSPTDDDEDDETPDPVRLTILSVVLVVLVGYYAWAYFHPPPKPYYTDIPGIDLTVLTPAQRQAVLDEANAMMCDCGEDTCMSYDVAQCRFMQGSTCATSLQHAREIVFKITHHEAKLTVPMPPTMRGGVPKTASSAGSAPKASGSAAPH